MTVKKSHKIEQRLMLFTSFVKLCATKRRVCQALVFNSQSVRLVRLQDEVVIHMMCLA